MECPNKDSTHVSHHLKAQLKAQFYYLKFDWKCSELVWQDFILPGNKMYQANTNTYTRQLALPLAQVDVMSSKTEIQGADGIGNGLPALASQILHTWLTTDEISRFM